MPKRLGRNLEDRQDLVSGLIDEDCGRLNLTSLACECFDHLIILSEPHLQHVFAE
jgi:hypothetical protein